MKNLVMKRYDDDGKLQEVKKIAMTYTWGEQAEADRVFEILLNDGWVIHISVQKFLEEFMRK